MSSPSPDQIDFFEKSVFETRTPVPITQIDLNRFRLRIKTAMSDALKGKDRGQIASQMGRMLGADSMSKGMLDAYCSPAKDTDISLVRFKALARSAEAPHLWDIAVCDDGLLVLQGDEARLAEIARLQQVQREAAARLRKLRAAPIDIKRGER